MLRSALSLVLLVALAACSTPPGSRSGGGTVGEYKIGNPYQVAGEWYTPHENYSYDETGIASWYGPGFAGRQTANGEIFDPNELTAAHRTLPMPSLVRVTNLTNGRSVVVRINDRGPFADGRVIDMSRRGAQLLGFEGAGVAKVRVSVLEPESRALAEGAMKRMGRKGTMMAQNQRRAPIIAPRPVETDMADASDMNSDMNADPNVDPNDVPDIAPVSMDDTGAETPQTASIGAVEKMALDAPAGISTQAESQVLAAAEPEAEMLPPVQPTARNPEPNIKSVAGQRKEGRFMPSEKVEQRAAKPNSKIYVQAGAFTVKENAARLKGQLEKFAPATVTQAQVNGTSFYRVRLGPMGSVGEADTVLAQVMGKDAKARITVE